MYRRERGYDLNWREYIALSKELNDSRRLIVRPDILRSLRSTTLIHNKEIGDYLFGNLDGEFLDVKKAVRMETLNSSDYQMDVDLEHKARTIEAMEANGLTYLGFWHHHPKEMPKTPSDFGTYGDVCFVRHPTAHTEDRLYIIGVSKVIDPEHYVRKKAPQQGEFDTVLNVYFVNSWDRHKKVLFPSGPRKWQRGFRRSRTVERKHGITSIKPIEYKLGPDGLVIRDS